MIHRVKNLPKVEIDMIDYNDSVGAVRVYQVSGVLHLPNRLEQIFRDMLLRKEATIDQ